MINAKVLKSKVTEGLYGVLYTSTKDEDTEIYECNMPQLFGKDATIEDIMHIIKNTVAISQIDDYDLISVEITEVE